MSEDLDSFFKSKNKTKGKKTAQNIEVLGKRLEQTVRKQEELDREEEERKAKEKQDEQFFQNAAVEDSEWIDFNEPKEVNLAAVGIKDMEIGEAEDDDDEETEEAPREPAKTWGAAPTAADAAAAAAAAAAAKENEAPTAPGKYVPSAMRRRVDETKAPEIDSTLDFPSLGDAETLVKQLKESEKKRQEMIERQTVPAAPTPAADGVQRYRPGSGLPLARPAAAVSAGAWQQPTPAATLDSDQQREPANPNVYVPGAFRRRQPATATQPAAGGAVLATTNRFDSLQDN